MRASFFAILSAAITAAAATAVMKVAGIPLHFSAMIAALVAAIIASLLAGAPLWLVCRATTITVMQAGLVSTMIHMFVLIVAAAIILFAHWAGGWPFIFWLYGLYMVTLVAMVMGISRAIHAAPHVEKKVEAK